MIKTTINYELRIDLTPYLGPYNFEHFKIEVSGTSDETKEALEDKLKEARSTIFKAAADHKLMREKKKNDKQEGTAQ